MSSWSASQYLKFGGERTQPCRDLAARVPLDRPAAVIDIGCGPGNSTAVLAERWPGAEITGLDSSPDMIAAARATSDRCHWLTTDIRSWADSERRRYDVVFSNAALQWLVGHADLFPKLLARVRGGGVLAVQLPSGRGMPAHDLLRSLGQSPRWRTWTNSVSDWHTEDIEFYYDVLAPRVSRIELWETAYLHLMKSADDIVQWYRGTGLRPFLEALPGERERGEFIAEYLEQIRPHYSPRPDGTVLFPFRRLFIVAVA